MWVTGTDPGTGNSVADPTLRWNDSWDFLRRLVWKADGSQVTLTRRWKLTVSGTPALVAADALAEIADTMEPTMSGRQRAEFTMTLLLADPYFYGAEVTTAVPLTTSTAVSNLGHDIAAYGHLEVDFIGPLTNPKLTNYTPNPDVWVKYNGAIGSGNTVRLKVHDFQANLVSTGANHIDKISHAGSRYWMTLPPGANSLYLTADSGTGSVVVRYRPPYV